MMIEDALSNVSPIAPGLLDASRVAVARRAGCEAILANGGEVGRLGYPRAIILNDFVGDDVT